MALDPVTYYPKPGRSGGTIIRRAIALLRSASALPEAGVTVHLACSGGADSVALSHLIQKYGRRIAPRQRLRLLHIHHGWRGAESDADAGWVESLGRDWGLPVDIVRLNPAETRPEGESWENAARMARAAVFEEALARHPGVVFTAHHADDLAETFLWRLFTGTASVEAGAIAVRQKGIIRPLLRVRRNELRSYLAEEHLTWREDATNHEGRFLRSKMRCRLMPEVDSIFPRAVDHLVELALKAQEASVEDPGSEAFRTLFRAAGVNVRRSHWKSVEEKSLKPEWSGRLDLPGGWKLSREGCSEAWRLEKPSD